MANWMTKPIWKYELANKGFKFLTQSSVDQGRLFYIQDNQVQTKQSLGWSIFKYSIPQDIPHSILMFEGMITQEGGIAFYDKDMRLVSYFMPNRERHNIRLEIPKNATELWVSYKADWRYRLKVSVYGYLHDITEDVQDWQELEVIFKRQETSGTFKSISVPIQLRGKGAQYVKEEFEANGVNGEMMFIISKRENKVPDRYELLKSLELDFTQYDNIPAIFHYPDHVNIQGVNDELGSYLKSFGKTKYDIRVDEIADTKKWNYKRLEYRNEVNWLSHEDETISALSFVSLFVRQNYTLISPISPGHLFADQQSGRYNGQFFFRAASSVKLNIQGEITGIHSGTKGEIYLKVDNTDSPEMRPLNYVPYQVLKFNETIDVPANATLSLVYGGGGSLNRYTFSQSIVSVSMEYNTGEWNEFIEVIEPEKLLQKFLNLMTSREDHFVGSIQWRDKDVNGFSYQTMIVAAESAQGFNEAYLHGSPNDFFEWMRVLGYEYETNDREVVFKPREAMFDSEVTALELGVGEASTVIEQTRDDFLFTQLSIGYDISLDSMASRYESNGLFHYTSDFKSTTENKLELISPYRADSVGFDMIVDKRSNKSSSDSNENNDIFFVALVPGEFLSYTEFRDIELVKLIFNKTIVKMFNAPFSPYFLVKMNEHLLGISTKDLRFASTNLARGITLKKNGETEDVDIYSNHTLESRLFEPVEYRFEAGTHQNIPDNSSLNGLVKVNWRGQIVQGYIKEIRKNYNQETATTWFIYKFK